MNYKEARQYLARAEQNRGIRPGLSRMRRLMRLLGNPERKFTAGGKKPPGGYIRETEYGAKNRTPEGKSAGIIHVAGTNGKGSVLAFLDEILRRAGYHVVKYTSPAVFFYLERYMVNGKPVSEETYADAAERVFAAAGIMSDEDQDPPTAFEMETAIAYLIAAEADCDVFLLETGMGGRLDATNIGEQVLLSVITSVSLDHMAYLGNTVREIAAEKAGIIREGCPVVVSSSNRCTENKNPSCDAAAPIAEAAAKHHAPLFWGDENVPYRISLPGTYQRENAGTACAAVRVLRQAGFDLPESCVKDGFENTRWPGRFEVIKRKPLCILDGAHNANAAEKLAGSLREEPCAGRKKYFVLGIFKDKEYEKVVRATVPLAEEVFVFSPASPRGLPAEQLAACVKKYTERPVHICEGAEAAARSAYKQAMQEENNGMVLCYGSLSFLGDARRALLS